MDIQIESPVESEVFNELRAVVIDVLRLEISPREIRAATNLYELGLESLNVVELLIEIEKTFKIAVDVEDLTSDLFTRCDRLLSFVEKKIHERG